MHTPHFHRTTPHTSAGLPLRQLRRQAGLSQLQLAMLAGISQRHLSCIETGRAKPGPGTLHALLMVLETPLEQCNEVFLAAGLAPRYAATDLDAPALEAVRLAIDHLLQANNPAPAIVIDGQWDVRAANGATAALFALIGLPVNGLAGLNLLDTLLEPGGLGEHLVNAGEVRAVAWRRASQEALGNPGLAERLGALPPLSDPAAPTTGMPPLLLTRIASAQGELSFMSTFTTFGMPLDITVASLRIEHLIPADAHTWQVMTEAWQRLSASASCSVV
ncbi:helix-turn-helix domain-containing protein [Pseudomonas reidholzensis]|nr:helix-turn-helix domain-containing protein [Pseudomonas reidholzensis]